MDYPRRELARIGPEALTTLETLLKTLVEVSVDTGIADATSTVNFLDDTSKSWPPSPGGFENLIIEITEGTGIGQFAKIAANTATRLTFVAPMPVAPDATSKYRIGFFGKMASDITAWGGTALTGRDISLDLKALTDDSIKGLLKSIGDIAALENLITRIGQTTDAIVAAGAVGSVSAKLRRLTSDLGSIGIILTNFDVALSTRASEATLAKIIPIAKASLRNTALPAAEADLLAADITPTNSPSYLRIFVCISVAGILRVARTAGGTTLDENLNAGNALVAGAAYMFTVPWRTGDAINLEYSVTTGTINSLIVDEIGGAE